MSCQIRSSLPGPLRTQKSWMTPTASTTTAGCSPGRPASPRPRARPGWTTTRCFRRPQGINPELVHIKMNLSVGLYGFSSGESGGRSVDKAHAQRGDCQALQDSPGRDDAVPVVLQCARVGRCLVFVGGGGKCAVDRRADAQVEEHPDDQQCQRCSCGG